jgi:hypothetical protein
MTVRAMFLAMSGMLAAGASVAASPSTNDYASGMSVLATYGQPMIETVLPEEVYRTATREDLGDLRVFNAEGMPVPHAFCAAPQANEPKVTEASLPVFVLRGREPVYMNGARVEVQTPSGTRVGVNDSSAPEAEVVNRLIHIIDAREVNQPLRAIRFDWSSTDGVSEVKVRIEASDDLDRWQTIVPTSTLLLAQQGEQELRRERIQLPAREYEYLRVQRVDGGPPLAINSVMAERVEAAEEIEPVWFTANHVQSNEADSLLFDAAHLAPVTYARLRLPQENSSVGVTIQSRKDDKSVWYTRWSGESYIVVTDTNRRESPPARFQPTTDRLWRVQIQNDPQLYQAANLELGYYPARVRFLAQGSGPFTVAFGSRRAEPAHPARCDGLLADVSAADREKMVAVGYANAVFSLSGEPALQPLPKKTPVKVVVLWGVLVVGVALLVGMALSLLQRVRKPGA